VKKNFKEGRTKKFFPWKGLMRFGRLEGFSKGRGSFLKSQLFTYLIKCSAKSWSSRKIRSDIDPGEISINDMFFPGRKDAWSSSLSNNCRRH